MSNRVLVNEDSLIDIAAAIKEQNGDATASYTPSEMGDAIRSISTGGGEVNIDNKTIVYNDDGQLMTAIGGFIGDNPNINWVAEYYDFTLNLFGSYRLTDSNGPRYIPYVEYSVDGNVYRATFAPNTADINTYYDFGAP